MKKSTYNLNMAVTDIMENTNNEVDIELYMEIHSNKIHFGHFGCWGLDGCAESGEFRKVINNQLADNLNFNIVTGDNVYMNEIYDKNILDGGIDCLNNLSFPSYAILGNHDVMQCNIMNDQIDRTELKMSKGKLMVDLSESKWVMPHNYYNLVVKSKNTNVEFIFIDTNLFNDYAEDCYKYLQNKKSISRKKRLGEMLQWFENTIEKSVSDIIIIVGHVYLFGYIRPDDMYGNTNENDDDKIVSLMHVEKLLYILNKYCKHRKIYYMCSDIHNYQYVRFTGNNEYIGLNIDIITAGIGGGIPDPLPKSSIGRTDDIKIGNENIGDIELLDKDTPYGYLHHIIDESELKTFYVKNELKL